LLDGSGFNFNAMCREFSNDFSDCSVADETQVSRSWRRDVRVREVLRAKRMQIDLLASKVKSVEIAFKHDMIHSKDPFVELHGRGYVAHGQYQMINARDSQLWAPLAIVIEGGC
jgi:hypothetical protein